jgi:hypothetical protein
LKPIRTASSNPGLTQGFQYFYKNAEKWEKTAEIWEKSKKRRDIRKYDKFQKRGAMG